MPIKCIFWKPVEMLLGNHAKESYHLVPADSGFSLQPPASPVSIRYRYSYDCSRSLRFIIKFGIIIITFPSDVLKPPARKTHICPYKSFPTIVFSRRNTINYILIHYAEEAVAHAPLASIHSDESVAPVHLLHTSAFMPLPRPHCII